VKIGETPLSANLSAFFRHLVTKMDNLSTKTGNEGVFCFGTPFAKLVVAVEAKAKAAKRNLKFNNN
jgi:hypothetical protein